MKEKTQTQTQTQTQPQAQAQTKQTKPQKQVKQMKQATYFDVAIEGIEVVTKTTAESKTDQVVKGSILYDVDKSTAVHYAMHSVPSFGIKGVKKFYELSFTQTVDMPHSFFAAAAVWNHTLLELRRKYRGLGWVALKVSHDSDLMPILARRGFIPTMADDDKTQVVVAFLASGKDGLDSTDQVSTDYQAKTITVTNYGGKVTLTGSECKLDPSAKVSGVAVGAEALGVYFDNLRIYNVSIENTAGSSFYYGYATLGRLLKSLLLHMKEDPCTAVGILASNRLEAIACLEAGFFPIESDGNETLYIKTR